MPAARQVSADTPFVAGLPTAVIRLAQGGLIPAQHDRGLAVTGTRSEADRCGFTGRRY
jgi:hypothetical protein